MNKKEFQKVIKDIRGEKEYPKAMMTAAQMDKRTATVNCGGEWLTTELSRVLAITVLNDQAFINLMDKYNAEAELELNSFGRYQIRIKY